MSSGNMKEIRKAQEAKRLEKIKKYQEAGRHYEYKPNPYKKGSSDYEKERLARQEKAKSCKSEFNWYRSQFAKLDNKMNKNKK